MEEPCVLFVFGGRKIRCGCSLCTEHSATLFILNSASACFVLESYVLILPVNTVLAQYSSCLILEQQNDRGHVIKGHPVKMSGGGGVVPRSLKPGS